MGLNIRPCRIWPSAPDAHGYGRVKINGHTMKAHRLAYKMQHRLSDADMPDVVCHSCDVRKCVEETHLFPGTAGDNRADCVDKKRHAHGESHGSTRLTEGDVLEIRRLAADEPLLTQAMIGELFGLTQCTTGKIINRKSWTHV